MKAEDILIALGDIDESLPQICDEPFPKRITPIRMKWISAAAACAAAILLSTVALTHRSVRPPVTEDTTSAEYIGITAAEQTTLPAADQETKSERERDTAMYAIPSGAVTRLPRETVQTAQQSDTWTNAATSAAQWNQPSRAITTTQARGSSLEESSGYVKATQRVPSQQTTTTAPSLSGALLPGQYPDLMYQGRQYTSRGSSDLQGKTGRSLGTAVLYGSDGDPDSGTQAELFIIPDISADAAVAVQFSDGSCFAYVNTQYAPDTLGELMDGLNLRANLTYGNVIVREDGYEATTFPAPEQSAFWSLFDRAAKPDASGNRHTETVTIQVQLPLLGYSSASVGLTADGYLILPIVQPGNAYYIGEERVQAFLQSVRG